MRPLSHSSITLYRDCPQKYKFKYIDKLPEKPKSFFSFGKSVHSALEFFYNIPALPAPTLEQILEHYKQNWISEGYKDPEQERENFEEGERILRKFYRKHIGTFQPPFFAEYKFDLKVEGVPVIGFVDRIDKVEGGKLAVLDYKTGKAFDGDRVKTDAQLTMYQMACEELLGMPVERLTFYHLNSLTEHTAAPHSKRQVQELRERIVMTADSIQKGLFDPRPEERKCSWCDFKPHCPAFRNYYSPVAPLPFVSKATAGIGGPVGGFAAGGLAVGRAADGDAPGAALRPEEDEELPVLVDRYGRLLDEVGRLQAEADQAGEVLTEKLRAKGWVRVFGSAYEATLNADEKWEFEDKTKVLDAIRKAGLWDDILAPSGPLVQKLMKNSALAPELRKRLESLGKRVEKAVLRVKRTE